MNELFSVEGRVAMVTGAGSGMGARFAETLSAYGASVILCGRRSERIEAKAALIRNRGGKALALPIDITDRKAIPALFDLAEQALGIVDILVNAAGISGDAGQPFYQQTSEDWDRVIVTNLTAVYEMSKEATKRLISANKPGNIINITSQGAHRGGRGLAAYTAAKAGCANLTRSMALDLIEFDIRVNAIAPGIVRSEMFPASMENSEFGKAYVAKSTPLGRAVDPCELDGALMLLASRNASSFITGTQIDADGGINAAQPGAW